jgi:non-canonical purine NTP pyrophosphatase (RdgB/HAM1 family)
MNQIYFVTGNEGKFAEIQALIPQVTRVHLDLPEEQSLDPQLVIKKKLEVARGLQDGPLIVEDTSLYLDGLNGFPGPLIKWMLQAVQNKGIYELAAAINNRHATAKTVIGYDDGTGNISFFEGTIDGQIVAPIGNDGFGWDDIFKPNGIDETFAEMGDDLKPEFSMRTEACKKLKLHLEEAEKQGEAD